MKTDIIKKLVKKCRVDHISQYIKTYHLDIFNEIITNTSYMEPSSVFTERLYHIINNFKTYPKCPICGKNTKFINFIKGYSKFCSVKCSCEDEEVKRKKDETNLKIYGYKRPAQNIKVKEKVKRTKLKKYGNENYINVKKIKQVKKEKYGDENYTNRERAKKTWANKSLEIKKIIGIKKKQTCLEKYGTNSPAGNLKIQEKMRLTSLEKYGVENYCKSEEYKEKTRKQWAKLFFDNVNNFSFVPLFKEEDYIYKKTKYQFKCKKCEDVFEDNFFGNTIPRCLKCYPLLKGTSKAEKELQNWLENYIKIEKNKRFFFKKKKYELDIFIPSKNIGIEFNGLYWHSEINGSKDKNYHLDKTKYFKEKDIQVIHIFEDEWIEKQEIIKSIILSKLGLITNKIFARKCQIKEIPSKEAKLFLFDNHIQGEVNSKINLGLYFNNELTSLMSFSKSRFNKNYNWEMTRFCNKMGLNVVGGASKLFKYFKTNYLGSIISYADLRFSNGNLYNQLEFKQLKTSFPNYYYFKNYIRISRQQFQKHKLKDKLKIFDPNLTEWQNMQLNGYDRIWDCGNLVFGFQ